MSTETEMQAGRELDALIAATFFGEKWELYPKDSIARMGGALFAPLNVTGPDGKVKGLLAGPLRYSTDIAAAWLVVEKMRERNVEVSVYTFAGDWMAQITGAMGALARESSAPLAICRAALAAVSGRGS
jgi:hypothetical protein